MMLKPPDSAIAKRQKTEALSRRRNIVVKDIDTKSILGHIDFDHPKAQELGSDEMARRITNFLSFRRELDKLLGG